MEDRKQNFEYLVRFIIIAAAAAGTILLNRQIDLRFYLPVLLLFILNTQLRTVFFKNRIFLFSLFIDLGIAWYIIYTFGGLSHLLLLIPVFHGLTVLNEEGIIVSAVVLGLLLYFIKDKGFESIITAIFAYSIICAFSYKQKKLVKKVDEMELLYDQNRRYSYQLEDAKKRLEEYSKRVEQLSQLEERNRISQEIHDSIGHKLTGVMMQIEATDKVMEVDTQKGREMLSSARENMSLCVEMLRQTVKNMKPKEYGSRILSIGEMIRDFSRTSGVNIDFEVSGSPVKLYPSAEITLFRNAQEALTNAVRHGKAKNISVLLEFCGREVFLTVKDDGCGCKDVIKGMGLSGMEERTLLLGGRLELSSEGGFEIKTVIPVK